MEHMPLPGLDRLIAVCARERLSVRSSPPGRLPPPAGKQVGGLPMDPELSAFYARYGGASFASDIYLLRVNDEEDQLEEKGQWWRADWQERVGLPLFLFGGVSSLAYYFATVPDLMDTRGCQPVVQVDTYGLDGPTLLPIASSVDRYFDTYARYLEELVAHEDFEDSGAAALSFPWKVPHLLARDARLVQLIREGHFDPFLPGPEGRSWAAKVVAHDSRS